MLIYIIAGIITLLLIYIFVLYNSLINLSNRVKEAFATMDVYLKKRWDLIPNIVEAVKGYANYEKDTLEKVISLRNSAYDKMSTNDKIDTNEQLTTNVSKLMMLVEAYPDLKANKNFLDLSSQLSKVEEDILNARKYYNAVVRNMNNKVQMFPSNLFSKLFGFKEVKYFEANKAERENVKVEL